ncbi:MAG TPA: hypothetical protein VK578_24505 [Edaphobacter sp.]|nr:hypothetical protein [Edaphobacter sp.]
MPLQPVAPMAMAAAMVRAMRVGRRRLRRAKGRRMNASAAAVDAASGVARLGRGWDWLR